MKNKFLASSNLESKNVIGGKVNGKVVSLNDIVDVIEEVQLITMESDERQDFMNHTCAQVLAHAVKRLYKGAILGNGSYQKSGFSYEFQLPESIRAEELPRIEQEMENILAEKLEIERLNLSYENAAALLSEKGEELKLELLHEQRENNQISIYKQGEFIDLYSGPQLPSAEFIKAFKLSAVSGSYWKGDKNNQVLQRISGIAFASKKELALHVKEMEELKKRDHRKIGKEMKLFMFSEEAPGMPFFLPNGQLMRNELQNFLREIQVEAGYREVQTPLMMNENLWRQSGHWDHYHENMYFSDVDEAKFA